MNKIEICINCNTIESMQKSVQNAYDAGAERIELCGDMELDGLTPDFKFVKSARKLFKRNGVLTMIRPRSGNFYFSKAEVNLMNQQIIRMAELGVNGVIFGLLRKNDNSIDEDNVNILLDTCKKYSLQTTFHRAFDCTSDQLLSLKKIIELKFDRILTSGIVWGSSENALNGINRINQLIENANGKIEIVVGGGINFEILQKILNQIYKSKKVSFHSYSGVLINGISDLYEIKKIKELKMN